MSGLQIQVTRSQVNQVVSQKIGRDIDDQEWETLKTGLSQLIRGYLFLRLLHSGFSFKEYMTKLLTEEYAVFDWHFGFSFRDLIQELDD